MKVWPQGLGADGSELGTALELHTTGDVWFVDSETGTDGISPLGRDEKYPLETLAQAVTNAAAGDIIVLASSHDETITEQLSIAKRLTIVGSGSSAGIPSATIRCGTTSEAAIEADADGIRIINVAFYVGDTATGLSTNPISAAAYHLEDCYFELADGASSGATFAVVTGCSAKRCTFKSARTEGGTGGVGLNIYTSVNTLVEDCVFDAGEFGWSGGSGLYAMSDEQSNLVLRNLSLLRGSDVLVNSGSTGYWYPGTTHSKGRVVW